jgi:hypothetical protein
MGGSRAGVPDIHVPSVARRWNHREPPGLGRCDADRADHREARHLHPREQVHPAVRNAREAQCRLREPVGQQAEARDVRRPAPCLDVELEDLDDQRVARPCALDEDRTRDRIDAGEVERRKRTRVGIGVQLAARSVFELDDDRVAGRKTDGGRDGAIPDVMGLRPRDVHAPAFATRRRGVLPKAYAVPVGA